MVYKTLLLIWVLGTFFFMAVAFLVQTPFVTVGYQPVRPPSLTDVELKSAVASEDSNASQLTKTPRQLKRVYQVGYVTCFRYFLHDNPHTLEWNYELIDKKPMRHGIQFGSRSNRNAHDLGWKRASDLIKQELAKPTTEDRLRSRIVVVNRAFLCALSAGTWTLISLVFLIAVGAKRVIGRAMARKDDKTEQVH